jgi:hypothetical protein
MDFSAHVLVCLVRDESVIEAHAIQIAIAETFIGRDQIALA